MPDHLSHLDSAGRARMVDVSDKPIVRREAIAAGAITLHAATVRAIAAGQVPKGEVLSVARIAGIQAAKRCGELIPLCHPLPIESVTVDFEMPTTDGLADDATVSIAISAVVRITAKTGVEMEALTAVSIAGLTIYDMCKAIDKSMTLTAVRLLSKIKQ